MSDIIYTGTAQYNLIYIFSIPDSNHEGYLKIGETSFDSASSYLQLEVNCNELNENAHNRIKQYTRTALTKYDLLHTELARKQVRLADGTVESVSFSDHNVHEVLDRSGYDVHKFYDTDRDSEWYKVTLPVAIKAIQAVKEGRNTLSALEKNEQQNQVNEDMIYMTPSIKLRDEQLACIMKTKVIFEKADRMLWDCKMRFGKTVTAYSLINDVKYQKVLVVTHRPAVVDGWKSDFDLIFKGENRVFVTKANIKEEDRFTAADASIDAENDRVLLNLKQNNTPFVYFASMQDLRGSKVVDDKCKYEKNRAVFSMDWDLIIYDEAHEGTQTELGLNVQKLLEKNNDPSKSKKVLQLSGTPYNIINQYSDGNVYSWDYVMEQRCKREWDDKHPGDHNPYADLPELRICTFDLRKKMNTSYRYEDENIAFNFREFFRTWTGNPEIDYRQMPSTASIGDFVYKEDVNTFLDLISSDSEDSNYPFASENYRDMFKHTFWILPGVKEARAFSTLLSEHKIFKDYKVVNVAGEGDVEQPYDDALKAVRKAIKENDKTITLSCGKLTTGVTVKEWTGVMLLSGSSNTAAAGYMQTIFRVQSAGSIDGKQKKICYAFDFAPDRTLKVISEVHQLKKSAVGSDDEGRVKLGEFLNFCPVLAEGETGMEFYDVPKMMKQLKRLTVDAAIKSGFDDDSIYKTDAGIVLDQQKIQLIDALKARLNPQKKSAKEKKVTVNDQGLTEEEYKKAQQAKHKPKKERTPEEKDALEKERELKKKQQGLFDLLRNISIRLPLLIYGSATRFDESIKLEEFIDIVDDASWKEFMPKEVDKDFFLRLLVFYDKDVVEEAGLRIRRLAKAADELYPTQRVVRIAEIFSYFKNPARETVLTPWRIVNLHLGQHIGGFNFYKENYPEKDGSLEIPRFVDNGTVTSNLFHNENVKVLELNSKTGLYPLYVAYSIYCNSLKKEETDLSLEEAQDLWDNVLENNLFVLCQTKMAVHITNKTLIGYRNRTINVTFIPKLVERMITDLPRVGRKITNPQTWNKEGERMVFNAVVGNPPYQEETVQQVSDVNGQAPRKSIFQYFQMVADNVSSGSISLIYPGARWIHRSGKGMAQFGYDQINDVCLERLDFYQDAKEIFKDAAIADGIAIVLKNKKKKDNGFLYVYHKGETEIKEQMKNPGQDLMALNPRDSIIVNKVAEFVENNKIKYIHDRVLPRNLFGIESNFVENNPDLVKEYDDQYVLNKESEIKLFTNDKAGKAGRAKWFVANKNVIENNSEFIKEWQVVVSSANAGGQKRDNQIEIIDNCSAFGRSRVALGSFKTKKEAENFYKYANTYLIKFMFLMTDESLTSLGMRVPDLIDFSDNNKMINFDADINEQLYESIGLDKDEIEYIEELIKNQR